MEKVELRNVKGTKDFLPEEQQLRNQIRKTLENVFEVYGCQPLETPILNYYDLLASKYGGGSEIMKEVYRLNDQGERELALRYDLTIPFAKVVGMNPERRLPFKRYEIGKVFRDGPIKTGRLREFVQCDVDIVGVQSVIAEAELMTMAIDAFRQLGLNVYIHYNNRKLLTGLLDPLVVNKEQINDFILCIDKLEKIGLTGVEKELRERNIDEATIKQLIDLLASIQNKSLTFISERFSSPLVQEGVRELQELERYIQSVGIDSKVRFNTFLARGLNIYTGTIYEVFLTDGSITSSIGSGGRYDQIIGDFLANGKTYPTVGISFGLDVIYAALSIDSKVSLQPQPYVDVFIIPLGTSEECLKIARQLREDGIRVEIDLTGKRLKKSLNYANNENVPFVLILGENELKDGAVTLKNMMDGYEKSIPLYELRRSLLELINTHKSSMV
jgi:histidyl-tRNA synthetase